MKVGDLVRYAEFFSSREHFGVIIEGPKSLGTGYPSRKGWDALGTGYPSRKAFEVWWPDPNKCLWCHGDQIEVINSV
jgi:hypothetical protein